jgi:diguanylate cyclase (GGDEF)-like protein
VQGCRPYDSAVRWDHDTILLVFPHASGDNARAIAERMRALVAHAPIEIAPERSMTVSASFGVATLAAGRTLPEEALVEAARRALAEARAAGPNEIRYANGT